MEQQNKYRVIVSARAADNTHIPMGIPAYFIADTSRLPLPVPAIPGRLRHVHRKIS